MRLQAQTSVLEMQFPSPQSLRGQQKSRIWIQHPADIKKKGLENGDSSNERSAICLMLTET